MTRFAHHVQPGDAGASREEFALVHTRYVAMPAALWALAVVAALVATGVQQAPAPLAQPATVYLDSTTWGA